MRLFEFNNKLTFKIAAPSAFSVEELQGILRLIESESQVASAGLMSRIKQAKLLGVALDSNNLVAVSAIKIPNPSYHEKIFAGAGVPQLMYSYPYEMGWKVVLPRYRGQNLGRTISGKLLEMVNKKNVFSTVKSTNVSAIAPLKELGFSQVGTLFNGTSGNKIALFVGGSDENT